MNSRWLAQLVAVSVSLAPALGRADGPVRAALVLPPCPVAGVGEADLRAALDLELRSAQIDLVDPQSDALEDVLLEVRASCDAGGQIVVRALRESELRERSLSLNDLPAHTRTRALALALSGLVEGLEPAAAPEAAAVTPAEPEPEPVPKPKAVPEPKPRAKTPARPSPEQQRAELAELAELDRATDAKAQDAKFVFALRPEMRWFLGGDPLWGGRIMQSFEALSVGVGVLSGSTVDTPSGSVSVNSLQGYLGVRAAQAELGSDIHVVVEPRLGAGYVTVEASPVEGTGSETASELLLDAALLTVFEYRSQSLRTGLGLELGAARGMVATVDDQAVITYDGVFAGVLLSLGFAL